VEDITRPVVPCHRCETLTEFPVMVNFVEVAAGPGFNINFCLPCACVRYKGHFRTCPDCNGGRSSCEEARHLRRSILARRLDRAVAEAVAELKRRAARRRELAALGD
jgi:hypothetical protein